MGKYLILAAVAGLVAFAGWIQFGKSSPGASAQSAGAEMVKVTVPEFSDSAKLGKQIFDAKCAACHGENAAGQDGVAPPLVHRIYEPNHHGDVAFLLAVRNGVRSHHWRFGSMPPVEGMTDADVAMVVEYIRALQRENGIG